MSSNKIVLKSSDGESFEVEEVVARKLQIVAHIIEDDCEIINTIPLQNVTGEILAMVIEYCKKHVDDDDDDSTQETFEEGEEKKLELNTWDEEFMKNLDQPTIFKLLLATYYLNVKDLLDLAVLTIADSLKDKTVDEVREIFNLVNDFTPEEEEEIRKENAWAFQ